MKRKKRDHKRSTKKISDERWKYGDRSKDIMAREICAEINDVEVELGINRSYEERKGRDLKRV